MRRCAPLVESIVQEAFGCHWGRVGRLNSTIDDVARLAGVARVTVSRVLNNEPRVSPKTRSRVHEAVEALGYSPNPQARALASGASVQILLVHLLSPEDEPNSYYHAGLELGALRACASLRFDLAVRAIQTNGHDAATALAAIIQREAPAGIAVSPPLADDVGLLDRAIELGARIVSISGGEEARKRVPAVGIDERAAGALMARHLLSIGHRRIGFVSGPIDHRAAALRYDGFTETMRSEGIQAAPWTFEGDFTFKAGVEAAERMLSDKADVTALACANDDMAAGAMLALHRAGLRIPQDISVMGFDDTPMSQVVWPPLSTIRQPIKLIAERAVYLLTNGWTEANQPQFELIPHELVVRESTAAPPTV